MSDSSKTSFGFDQIENETPMYAQWIFRGYFLFSKAIIGWVAAIGLFTTRNEFLIVTTISLLIDPIMLGFSKLFGIVPEEADPNQPVIATQQIDSVGDTKSINPVVVEPPVIGINPKVEVFNRHPSYVNPNPPDDTGIANQSYEEALKS